MYMRRPTRTARNAERYAGGGSVFSNARETLNENKIRREQTVFKELKSICRIRAWQTQNAAGDLRHAIPAIQINISTCGYSSKLTFDPILC